jgi:hypothetical protein
VSAPAAEILDRVVASIDNFAITESDVESEYRLERFLDGQWPPPAPDSATLDKVRERLTYQHLLLQEASRDAAATAEMEKDAAAQMEATRGRFAGSHGFQAALESLNLEEHQLMQVLTDQQRIMRVIEQRLRPNAIPSTPDTETYYHDVFVPEYKKTHDTPPPPLGEVESQIREVLTQKRIDQLLSAWLDELRPGRRVRFH